MTRDLAIRPLTVGGMIDRAVALTVRHFRPLFVTMLLVQAPAAVAVRLESGRASDLLGALADPTAFMARASGMTNGLLALAGLLLILQALATSAAAAIVAPTLVGPPAPGGPPAARRALAALGCALLQVVLLAGAPLLGALPGLWLASRATSFAASLVGLVGAAAGALVLFLVVMLRTILAPAVAAIEGRSGPRALLRSSRLMAPRPGQPILERPSLRASLLLLATFLIALAVNGLATLPRALAGRFFGGDLLALAPGALPLPVEVVLGIFEACAGAALQPFSLAALAVFYFERRARTEGLDLERWVAGLEASR